MLIAEMQTVSIWWIARATIACAAIACAAVVSVAIVRAVIERAAIACCSKKQYFIFLLGDV